MTTRYRYQVTHDLAREIPIRIEYGNAPVTPLLRRPPVLPPMTHAQLAALTAHREPLTATAPASAPAPRRTRHALYPALMASFALAAFLAVFGYPILLWLIAR